MERLYKYIEITDLKDMLKKSGEKYGDKNCKNQSLLPLVAWMLLI